MGAAQPNAFAAFANAPLTTGFGATKPFGSTDAKPKSDAGAPGPAGLWSGTANQKDKQPSATVPTLSAAGSGFGQNRLPFAGAGGAPQKPAGVFSSGFAGFGQKPAESTGKSVIGFGFTKPEPASKRADAQAPGAP